MHPGSDLGSTRKGFPYVVVTLDFLSIGLGLALGLPVGRIYSPKSEKTNKLKNKKHTAYFI